MDSLQQKLQAKIDSECSYADKHGSSKFSVCDHYNWDKDFWNHRHAMVDAINTRGYGVSVSVSFGVTDIVITKPFQLS